METNIGQHFRSSAAERSAILLGIVTIFLDFLLVGLYHRMDVRLALALTSFVILLSLTNNHTDSLGLRWSPKQGWKIWIRWSILLGLLIGVCLAVGLGIVYLLGYEIPIYTTAPKHLFSRFLDMCFVAPVLEETIYRLIVCVSLVKLLGPRTTIAFDGVLFGALHVLYGVPSPENLVGGFVLAWAYLKSESIAVPVVLHSLGNMLVLIGQVAGWYWMQANG